MVLDACHWLSPSPNIYQHCWNTSTQGSGTIQSLLHRFLNRLSTWIILYAIVSKLSCSFHLLLHHQVQRGQEFSHLIVMYSWCIFSCHFSPTLPHLYIMYVTLFEMRNKTSGHTQHPKLADVSGFFLYKLTHSKKPWAPELNMCIYFSLVRICHYWKVLFKSMHMTEELIRRKWSSAQTDMKWFCLQEFPIDNTQKTSEYVNSSKMISACSRIYGRVLYHVQPVDIQIQISSLVICQRVHQLVSNLCLLTNRWTSGTQAWIFHNHTEIPLNIGHISKYSMYGTQSSTSARSRRIFISYLQNYCQCLDSQIGFSKLSQPNSMFSGFKLQYGSIDHMRKCTRDSSTQIFTIQKFEKECVCSSATEGLTREWKWKRSSSETRRWADWQSNITWFGRHPKTL